MAVQDLSKICWRQPLLCRSFNTHGVTVFEVDWLVLAVSRFYNILTKLKPRKLHIRQACVPPTYAS